MYGDDSTTLEDAPSAGNLYIRIERDKTQFLWGDFQTTLAGMDLVQYSRALYGANFTHQSTKVTDFGEARTDLNLFAADPGTIASRDEFRGTGGTLYYLRRQDISEGSERMFVEVRDRDSQLVLSRQELIGATDYDLNESGKIASMSNLIRIDICEVQLERHPAQLAIAGDAADVLTQLNSAVSRSANDGTGHKRAAKARDKALAEMSVDMRKQSLLLNVMRDTLPKSPNVALKKVR